MSKKKIVIHNPDGLRTIPYQKLEDFQDDLKKISQEELRKLANSILEHGVFVPKFVWEDSETNKIFTIDGHQTKKALILLETEGYAIPEIPIVRIKAKNKTDAAKKVLQLNSRYGKIDPQTKFLETYKVEVEYLKSVEIQELDCKLIDLTDRNDEEDNYRNLGEEYCVITTGDVIEIGKHRIMCGDSNLSADLEKLFRVENVGFQKKIKANMALMDPPYDMNIYNWVDFIPIYLDNAYCFIICGDQQVQTILQKTQMKLQRFFVLDHTFSSPKGNDVYVRHLLMMRLIWGKAIPFKNLHDGFQTIIKMNYRGFLKKEEEVIHPHQKPVSIYNKFLEHFSDKNFTVFDMFLGSGTLLISAERMNRCAIGMEIDPLMIQQIINRICSERENNEIIFNGIKHDWNEFKKKQKALNYKKPQKK